MRAIFGLLLVMLGLAMAIVWMPEHDSERQLAVVTEIATQGTARRQDATDRAGRTFSPNTPLIASVEQPGTAQTPYMASVARVVRPSQEAAVASPPSPFTHQAGVAPAFVTQQAVAGATVVGPAMSGTNGSRPADSSGTARQPPLTEASRAELVRNLQRELKRVGCYAGDIDGDWGTGSRRAMSTFTDRVNASLPIEQPDFILLTLVQGQLGSICGKACPAGQSTGDNGRCTGGTVVASARRGRDRGTSRLSNNVIQYSSTQTALAPPAQDAGWTTQVTRTPATASAATNFSAILPATAAVAAAATVAAPLPGRMAMGGPQSEASTLTTPQQNHSAAHAAVRGQPQPIEEGVTRQPQTQASTERRERPRRAASRSGGYRYAPVVFRAPRFNAPTYYASAPRRGRSWTGSFFGLN